MTMTAQKWLLSFADGLAQTDATHVAGLFADDAIWRDYVAFDWDLSTYEGKPDIAGFAAKTAAQTAFSDPVFEGSDHDTEGLFEFKTGHGTGRGHIKLLGDRCATLFTMLDDIPTGDAPSPTQEETAPFVLIVGGGQGGLALGAQLSDLDVPYLIVDKYPRVGDQWRSRYASLVLHDPVWFDHLPFRNFPEDWPVFTPKDQMGDWLEDYAHALDLNVWTETEFNGARFDEGTQSWSATVSRSGQHVNLKPTHIVLALGISAFPRVPEFDGREGFAGPQMHSSAYKGGSDFAGQNVIVVGANNSAHDIASDLVSHGAKPIMIQRSSTLVVQQDDYCSRVIGGLYSAKAVAQGITVDKADILQAAVPIRHLERDHKPIWDKIKHDRTDYYGRLEAAGFTLDFAEDGTGLGLKYRRTASGYYIDVGAAEMVADGRIGLRSGITIKALGTNDITLDSGETLPADAIVYATGYGTMTDWVAALIDEATADKVGPCWGYGSGKRGDPGPWIGELRNMWKPTAQQGLWFTGGNLAQTRFYSRRLALQLKGQFLGLTGR